MAPRPETKPRPAAIATATRSSIILAGGAVAGAGPVRRQRAPTEREVAGGGAAIEGYRVGWLRSQLGLVRQEPVHFADSRVGRVARGR